MVAQLNEMSAKVSKMFKKCVLGITCMLIKQSHRTR